MRTGKIHSSNREELRRLDKLISICFITMFLVSTIVLAFAVHQILIARDLKHNNAELALTIKDLREKIKDLREENEMCFIEIDHLLAEIDHLKEENLQYCDELKLPMD